MLVTRNTWIFYVSQVLHSAIFVIPIWIVFYRTRISVAEISLVVSFQYLVQILLELPSGALADMLGRRTVTCIAFCSGALGMLLLPFATQLWHFLALSALIGLMDSFRSGAEEALIYDTYKEADRIDEFSKVYANGNFLYQLGLISGTAIGGILYTQHPFLPYFAYGSSLLIGSFCIYFYIEPHIDSNKFTLQNYLLQIKHGTQEAFKTRYNSYLSLFYIIVGGIAFTSTLYFTDFMMIELGFGNEMRGYLTAALRLTNLLIVILFLRNKDLFTWRRIILFFPLIMLVGYLPGIYLSGYFGLPFIQLTMLATTARWIILSPITNEAFSSKYRATAISTLSLFIGIVYIIITFSSGYIIPAYGMKFMHSLLGIISVTLVVPLAIMLVRLKRLS